MCRPRLLTVAASLALMMLMAGCPTEPPAGSDGGGEGQGAGDGGSNAGPIALDALDEAYVNGVCAVITQCYGSYYDYCSVEHCASDTAPLGYAALLLELDAGWTSYDAAAAGRCYQKLLADPCTTFGFSFSVPTIQQTLYGCGDALVGTRAAGQTCASVADCAPGTYCVTSSSCPGTCRTFLAAGASCTGTGIAPCDPSQNLTCRNGTCRPPWAAGDSCSAAADCSPDLWCKRDAGECLPLAGLGEQCERFGGSNFPECERDLRCSSPFGAGTCGNRLDQGEQCFDTFDCKTPLRCLFPLDGGSRGTCGPRQGQGGPCLSSFECEAELRCLNRSCQPYPALGQPCSTGFGGTPCASGLLCSGGTCVTALCPGQTCGAAQTACAEATCATQSSVCVVRGAVGTPCTAAAQCATNVCTAGVCSDTACRP